MLLACLMVAVITIGELEPGSGVLLYPHATYRSGGYENKLYYITRHWSK